MTPAQLHCLMDIHARVNGAGRDAGGHQKRERVHVNAEQAPAILAVLAEQRIAG